MKVDFNLLFKEGFPMVGLPNPIENKEFREGLLAALSALNEKEEAKAKATDTDEFVYSEKEHQRQLALLDAPWASSVAKNRAANWLLTAWEKGHINVRQS